MFTLIITLISSIGISHPTVLQGGPPYDTLEQCQGAGQEIVNWLTQDFITVQYECIQMDTEED